MDLLYSDESTLIDGYYPRYIVSVKLKFSIWPPTTISNYIFWYSGLYICTWSVYGIELFRTGTLKSKIPDYSVILMSCALHALNYGVWTCRITFFLSIFVTSLPVEPSKIFPLNLRYKPFCMERSTKYPLWIVELSMSIKDAD